MNTPVSNPTTAKRIVIVGATSAIAQACARQWAQTGPCAFVLIGRDAARLEAVAADLRARSGAQASVATLDFAEAEAIAALATRIAAEGTIDVVLIAHGSLPEQSQCQGDLPTAQEALWANGVSPVLVAEAFARHLEQARHGHLCIIGSVAGDRGRKTNYVYGAAKGMVERYAEGLQHRLAASPVRVTLAKPGPTDTPMTAHLKQGGARMASVDEVAQRIVAATERGQPVVYAPGKWALIMLVIRNLPRLVFHKMNI